MSLVVSGLVAMSVRVRLYELPVARAVRHVWVVSGERRAVVPVSGRRSGDGRRHHRRVVIAWPITGPVIVRIAADEKSAAHEYTRAAAVKVTGHPDVHRRPRVRRRRGRTTATEPAAARRAGVERRCKRRDGAARDGEPSHGPRIAPAALQVSSRAMTWSIIARDAASGAFGVAIATRFFAAGALCPRAQSGVGALSTQALVNPHYARLGLELLASGLSAPEVVKRLTSPDEGREHRQLHV